MPEAPTAERCWPCFGHFIRIGTRSVQCMGRQGPYTRDVYPHLSTTYPRGLGSGAERRVTSRRLARRGDARAAAGADQNDRHIHTHETGNCHMSWPHAHGMASGLLVASGHARAPRLAVAPLAGGPMIGLCPASIMRAVTLGARPRRREVRARMKPSLRE